VVHVQTTPELIDSDGLYRARRKSRQLKKATAQKQAAEEGHGAKAGS